MRHKDPLARLVLGALAGTAATFAMQGVRTASQKYVPGSMASIRQDPGEFMVERAEEVLPERVSREVPDAVENAAAMGLHMGYGATAGVLYAALRPEGGNTVAEGVLLGLGVWAAGYLGWLPAAGLMPPLTEQNPEQVLGSAARHALFGVVTALTYDQLRKL